MTLSQTNKGFEVSITSSVWQCEKCGAEGWSGGSRFTSVTLKIHQGKCVAAVSPYGLTLRQREVLGLIGAGLTDQQIASRMKRSQHTMHFHVKTLYRKLGVNNRTQAAVKSQLEGLGLSLESSVRPTLRD
jgi:DNA-binding CsgD family transcriptional regulator